MNLRLKDSPTPWKWEIYADGDRLFVAQSENGFERRADAVAAGELELQRWLLAARTGNGRPERQPLEAAPDTADAAPADDEPAHGTPEAGDAPDATAEELAG